MSEFSTFYDCYEARRSELIYSLADRFNPEGLSLLQPCISI